MSTEVTVALIAASAAVVGPLVTWIIARQTRSDERADIVRDLEILKNLNPASPQYEKLDKRVATNVDRLVNEQDRRDGSRFLLQLYFAMVTTLAAGTTANWLITRKWLPAELYGYVKIIEVLSPTLTAITLLMILAIMGKIIWLLARLAGVHFQLVWHRFRRWRAERSQRRADAATAQAMSLALTRGVTREQILDTLQRSISRSSDAQTLDDTMKEELLTSRMEIFDRVAAEHGSPNGSSSTR
ncbi:heme biosynthesis HemY N-terminal domain-containing protein [Rhodococcus hoagii]|nr:heme biosynthesis HemY N-terminal domain-containing protein [Prescottella equi]